ncbi:hypothetical protein BXQ17_13955 [Polaribacter sp. BM10]|uniref:lipopolysaccharide biosynthesis protein n=1 Tax=Polaribacter sp. BM10 TaxID=1529069 RepID=UPI00098A87D2|nr:oligosaccharide flippase family protein [Polaribacter sp. BM10]AQS95112.1 hypothetical protein BXQ17_13955 [Polaribacter sp. BM10]
MSKIFTNTIWYTIGKIIPGITGFLLLPVYAEYLTTEQYGILQSMQVLIAILSIFFTLATERSLFRIYYDYENEHKKKVFIGNSFFLIVFISTVMLGLMFLFKDLVSQIYLNIPFNPYYRLALFNAYFLAFSQIPLILYQINGQAKKFVILSISQFLVGVILILYFVLHVKLAAEGILSGQVIGNLIMLPFFLFIIYKNSNFKLDRKILKNILSFSIPMIPVLLSAWVLNMSNRIFIEKYVSLSEVGVFSFAFKIASIGVVVLGAFNSAFNPVFYKIANDNKIESKLILKKYFNNYVIIITCICFCICFFSKEIILIFISKNYHRSIYLIPILVLPILINQIGSLYNLMIYQEKKTLSMMFVNLISLIISFVLNVYLIQNFQTYGAAWATVFSVMILTLMKYFLAKNNYFVSINYRLAIVVFVVFVFIIYLDIYCFDYNPYYSILYKILFFILFFSYCLVFKREFFKKKFKK